MLILVRFLVQYLIFLRIGQINIFKNLDSSLGSTKFWIHKCFAINIIKMVIIIMKRGQLYFPIINTLFKIVAKILYLLTRIDYKIITI